MDVITPGSVLRIGMVRNPRSHRNARGKAEAGRPPVGHRTEVEIAEPTTREEIDEVLARFAARGIDLLIVDGGDGTVRDVLSRGLAAFGDAWPRLMVLPKGKTNALAVDLGMQGVCTLDEAVAALPSAHTLERRPLLIECEDGSTPPLMGFIMGAGVYTVAIEAGQVAHRYGAFQSFAVAVTALAGITQGLVGFGRTRWRDPVPMRLFVGADGDELPNVLDPVGGLRFAAGFSTLRTFPLGMKPFAGVEGSLRFLVYDRPLRRAMALAPAVLMGLDRPFLSRLGVHRGGAEQVTVELGCPFIVDGEAFPAGRYRVSAGPRLQFIVP